MSAGGRRAAVYCRISKDRVGAGLGVERQREDCRALAEKLGWTVVIEHVDNDLSAYSRKPRPGYKALLSDISAGRVDAVLALHTDRLHRSPAELEHYIATCDPLGVPTHTVWAGPLDLTTPSGRLVARQLGAVARYEVEHAIERQKRAKAQAAADGRFRGGRRAFGYESDGMTVRESEAALLRTMTSEALAGASMRSVAARLNAQDSTGTRGGVWTGASVREVLMRARNAGLIEQHGNIVGPARWPAIIDADQWRAVRAVLEDPARRRVKSSARRWLLTGLATCGKCGARVKIGSGGTTRPSMRPFYRCSGPTVHVARVAEHVDSLVERVVVARLSRPDAANIFAKPAGPDPGALHTEANAARARMDELSDLYASGAIDARQLTRGTDRLRTTLADLERRIEDAYAGSALAGLGTGPDLAARWEDLDLDRRRAVVDALLAVVILPGKPGRKVGGHYFDPASVQIEWRS